MPKLNRDGVDIYYEVHGAGPVILLSHGYSATSQMWRGQIEALSKTHMLVLWDMRGHGQSDYPVDPAAYSEAATVADMLAILDVVGAKTAIVGGLSLGGYMSLAFHLAHPERVRALLIIDTGPGYRNDEAREGWNLTALNTATRYETKGLGNLATGPPARRQSHPRNADGPTGFVRGGSPATARTRADTLEKDGLATLKTGSAERAYAVHRDALGLAKAARGMLTQRNPGVINSLASITIPAMVLVGADDKPFLAAADYMAAKIPGAVKAVIPNAGHAANIDQPEAFNSAVTDFLVSAGL